MSYVKIERCLSLRKWLDKHSAHLLWSQPADSNYRWRMSCYSFNGKLALVQERVEGGWEIFAPVCDSIRVKDTLEAAEKALGLNDPEAVEFSRKPDSYNGEPSYAKVPQVSG